MEPGSAGCLGWVEVVRALLELGGRATRGSGSKLAESTFFPLSFSTSNLPAKPAGSTWKYIQSPITSHCVHRDSPGTKAVQLLT